MHHRCILWHTDVYHTQTYTVNLEYRSALYPEYASSLSIFTSLIHSVPKHVVIFILLLFDLAFSDWTLNLELGLQSR